MATFCQVSLDRGTIGWVRLRKICHKNDANERTETLATSSMQRALLNESAIRFIILQHEHTCMPNCPPYNYKTRSKSIRNKKFTITLPCYPRII